MSILKKLFGGGGEAGKPADKPARTLDYKGFTIAATPYKEAGQFQTCGIVSKEFAGEVKQHRFIRADRFADQASAADHSILKGQQLVDQMGEAMFRQGNS
ncbi:MAG: hypothetical protein HY245_02310 [Rhizobiales bacterium]|nr:hypothetical protein [Hyphomicrobiales bacterium]MBI3672262.1 hypothetical protein [Hyphomicrobiales bacterium]